METIKNFLNDKESINTLINDYLLNVDYHNMYDCKTFADVISNVAEDYGGKRGYEIINTLVEMEEYEWVFDKLNEMYKRSLINDFNDFLKDYVITGDPNKNVSHFVFDLSYYLFDADETHNYFNQRHIDFATLAELYEDEELSINVRYKETAGDYDRYSISLNKYRDYFFVKKGEQPSIDDYKLYNLIIKAVNDRYTRHMCTEKYGTNYNEVCR